MQCNAKETQRGRTQRIAGLVGVGEAGGGSASGAAAARRLQRHRHQRAVRAEHVANLILRHRERQLQPHDTRKGKRHTTSTNTHGYKVSNSQGVSRRTQAPSQRHRTAATPCVNRHRGSVGDVRSPATQPTQRSSPRAAHGAHEAHGEHAARARWEQPSRPLRMPRPRRTCR